MGGYLAGQVLDHFYVADVFAEKYVQNRPAGIFCLEAVLQFQRLKNIIRVVHRKLARIRIIWRRSFTEIGFIGAYNLRKLLFVQHAKTV